MAMNPANHMALKSGSGGTRGFTLLELLVTLAMAGLVAGLAVGILLRLHGSAIRLEKERREKVRASALFSSLGNNIVTGGGILHLSPHRLELANRGGRKKVYEFADSVMLVDGRPFAHGLASVEFGATGPGASREEQMQEGYSALDGDRDGRVDMEDLDADFSGALEGHEVGDIALVRISLRFRNQEGGYTYHFHPRNRAPDTTRMLTAEEPK